MNVENNLYKLKNYELKSICNINNINKSGNKQELIRKIINNIDYNTIQNNIYEIINKDIDLNDYIYKRLNKYHKNKLLKFSKNYNLNIGKNKNELINTIEYYFYSKYEYYIIFIQSYYRYYLNRKINRLKGPALKNRDLCTNKTDFFNLQNIKDIPDKYFYSFKDQDNFIYGFEINSIYKMIEYDPINPYNRCKLSYINIQKINYLYKLINISNHKEIIFKDICLKQDITDAFLFMDSLGNYTNINWFNNLSNFKLKIFYRELEDIWNYRLSLSSIQKKEIVHPDGILFTIPQSIVNTIQSRNKLKSICIDVIKKLIYKGLNDELKKQGCYYVLMALTIVSYDAAIALPWLANSVLN